MTVRSSPRSRAYSGILFGFIITFAVNVSLRAQAPESPSASVRKPRDQDLTPPSAPRGLIAEVANCRQVELRWVAPTDGTGSGLKAYVVRRSDGGESTISAGRTTFSDANRVSPSTGLTYTVSAVDAGGNESATSNAVTVTTPACSSNENGVGDFEGTLEVLVEDYEGGRSRTLHFLQTNKERFPIRFTGKPSNLPLGGVSIHVRGGIVDGALAVASGDVDVEVLKLDLSSTSSTSLTTSSSSLFPMPPNTFGAQKTLVMLVNFQDNSIQPWTLDQVRSIVFGTVSNYFKENSYQQTWLSGDVVGWYTLPLSATACDNRNIASYADSAATAAGINVSAYPRHVYMFPSLSGCGWTGMATIGAISPSQAWINGSSTLGVIGHEMGHNLGLYHAHAQQPDGTTYEYGDTLDIMGSAQSAHYGAFQKERLGWLGYGTSPPITTVQASGNYILDPYESPGSKPKALKIPRGIDPTTGYKTYYYFEFRQAIGFDSFIATANPWQTDSANILSGVVTHTASEHPNSSFLLDMTPETYQSYIADPALDVGKSFSDASAGITVTPVTANSTGATVNVTFSCVHANPVVAISPSSQAGPAGASLAYTISVTNNDSTACSTSSYNLQAVVPAGWTAAFAASSLTLNPAISASTTLTVTSLTNSAINSYSFAVTAANGGYAATASAVYSIVSGPALSTVVSTDSSTYAPGATVTNTDITLQGGNPVGNASVTFTITKPNSAVVSQIVSSDSTGKAVYKLRLSRKDPKGIYQVRAAATSNGSSASATTSFTVQ